MRELFTTDNRYPFFHFSFSANDFWNLFTYSQGIIIRDIYLKNIIIKRNLFAFFNARLVALNKDAKRQEPRQTTAKNREPREPREKSP